MSSPSPYHLVETKHLLAFVRQVDLCDGDFPPLVALADAGADSAADDLVAEAYADDANAAGFKGSLGEVDEFQDPRVVVEGGVARAREQEGVDVFEGRVAV